MVAAISTVVAVWFGVHTIYPLAMTVKEAYEAGRLTKYWIVMLVPVLVLGLVLDFVFQFTFGWLMFVETPFRGGVFFSGRVQHHYRNSDGWRRDLAGFWARNLNVFDATHIK